MRNRMKLDIPFFVKAWFFICGSVAFAVIAAVAFLFTVAITDPGALGRYVGEIEAGYTAAKQDHAVK